MGTIAPVFAKYVASTVLPSLSMATEEALRQRILRLLEFGVTQKTIAGKMNVDEAWLSRWLRRQQSRAITVPEMDRLQAYIAAFVIALTDETEPPRAQQDQPAADRFRDYPSAKRPKRPATAVAEPRRVSGGKVR